MKGKIKYCSVCGRELKVSEGPIGPVCLKQMRPKGSKRVYVSKAQYSKMYDKLDLFGEIDGSEETNTTSKST